MKPIHAALVAAFLLSSTAQAEDKFLHFQFNKHTVITISNVACPMKQYVKEYPYAAVASRADGQKLVGCFKKQDENLIRIQWQPINGKESDFTIFPANAFLPQPPPVEVKPEL
jgi:hypothetical protein